ncbi:MAG: hypothetical protein A2W93_01610 [Bacteroidetes bacterium GWF2_43_63]|nr:MAG: hypothetical protein A2W94_10465 [Bacteroidetes bacterium GWE2_42_42]OFY55764.1 MAG: hypothetical protein A2W93_01610 [Bacteroidetes bacterium GWF2_43_63]HBG71320.1 hypothetical protein [Bacteroidales bacterium]HCB60459.1 hypothetical protein [Bacteroidales bacterium]HCY22584.1 hypothetical protein [Bacteroidales bacterium]
MQNRQQIHANINHWLTAILLFALPLYKKATPIIVILLLLNWLAEGRFRARFTTLFTNKGIYRFVFALLILFYIMHVAALLYTDNSKAGLFELEKKLSFLVLPLIFFPVSNSGFSRTQLKQLLLSYLAGTLAISLFCLTQSLIRFAQTGDSSVMYYVNFTQFEHPTYYAMYMITALILVVGVLITEWKNLKSILRIAAVALVPYYILIIMLANSRAAIIAMTLVAILTIVYFIIRTKKYTIGLILLLALCAGFPAGRYLMPHVYDRFLFGLDEVFAARKMEDIKHWNGTTLRVQVYYCDAELIKENFWAGVSPGDVCDELAGKYSKYGFRHALERNYNAHNQFLQTFIGLGIAGFLVLLLIVLIPFIYAARKNDYVLMAFTLMVSVLFMFESMLQLQAGIMFIAAGISLLTIRNRKTIIE